MHYYLVSPTRIVRADASSFTYSSEERLPTGMIVAIEIGKINAIGVVLQEVRQPDFEVKPISKIIEEYPLPIELVQTAIWMSKYYATHQATVWQAILPSGLSKKRRSINQSTSVNQAENRTKNVFTDEQKSALQTIENLYSGTALLHGVTGSGKTLVYIEAAKQTLKEERSSIILVPEIALTSQLVAEFSAHLPNVIVTHSKQTEAQRYAIWKRVISSNDPVVIIGPRSALFMPVQQLGLVVIDECHEPSFKQEQSPRYSALRVASVLTNQHRGKLILGSATPAVADYYVAKKSNTPIITMTKPARPDTVRPNVTLVDMTKRNNFTQHQFLSDPLLKSIKMSKFLFFTIGAAQHRSHYVITAAGRLAAHAVLFRSRYMQIVINCHATFAVFRPKFLLVALNVKTPISFIKVSELSELKTNYRGYSRTKKLLDLIKTPT